MTFWCEALVIDGITRRRVRVESDAAGTVTALTDGLDPAPGEIRLGTVLPGIANAHSHAFHRALRGRTHDDGGDFWSWRTQMYRAAARLTPERYGKLARAVFAEMLAAGYTAVGEFHYVHHQLDGTPYPHEIELAIVEAAAHVGIRLMLLDAAYLAGGVGRPLEAEQTRFGDGSALAYLNRWHDLSARIPGLGAAIHSVRAVSPDDIRTILDGLPDDIPLHVHVSEQLQENDAARAAYGRSPTELLGDAGALSPRLSAVHATHLSTDDIRLLGAVGSSVVICPTTEADLGDGIGPARELLDAGARLAIGSDQNAVVDPLLEIRGLEMHDRLRSQRRGRFSLRELSRAASADGYRSLGHAPPLTVGGPLDLVEIDERSVRTVGSAPEQLLVTATAHDVTRVVVGGRLVASNGLLTSGDDPAELLADAIREVSG